MLAHPLIRLTRKNVPFVWCDLHEVAFKQLNEKLCFEPVVCMYNFVAKVTQGHIDASSVALSGILLQGEDAKDLHKGICRWQANY